MKRLERVDITEHKSYTYTYTFDPPPPHHLRFISGTVGMNTETDDNLELNLLTWDFGI